MLARCVFCHTDLPANETLEHFQVGKRIAFDPARGRLWAICPTCQRWNLAPFEQRWEALEELERLTQDRGRLLRQSDNIALLRAEDLDIVRVGRAKLVEEAWWRYGKEMQRRNTRHQVVRVLEVGAYVGILVVASGFWFLGGGEPINNLIRWRKFGSALWRGERFCVRCGRPLRELKFERAKHLVLQVDSVGDPMLQLRCKRCGFRNPEAGYAFTGPEAERMLRRNLAYYNFAGTTEKGVRQAVEAIDTAGGPHWLLRQLAREQFAISHDKKKTQQSIALEIAVNDQVERQLLELELKELEARWKEEEELAAIVDGELTELPLLERIRTMLPG